MNTSTRLSELTVGQLSELIREEVAAALSRQNVPVKYVYGIPGLAWLFGCSETQAKRIKSSGAIDRAISQRGRTIVVDAELAVRLYGEAGKRERRAAV